MDYRNLVTPELAIGEAFAREFDKRYPVKAAFWMKTADNDRSYLYISSDQIREDNHRQAIEEVVRLAPQFESPFFDMFSVKVLDRDHPLAQAAAERLKAHPTRTIQRLQGPLGNAYAEEGFLYPVPLPADAA